MYSESKVFLGKNDKGDRVNLIPKMANRHGIVAGATGTGKTVTLKVMAESFSEMGVPVFMADVKGDIAGLACPGEDSEDMKARISRFGLEEAGFKYDKYPVTLWDIYGEKGVTLRTTISEIGPLLLSRLMELNTTQSDILNIVFKIADDNGLLLIDTKDLKSMLNYVSEHNKELEADYGKMSPQSIAAIVRAVVALELAGGDKFFGEPAINIMDFFTVGEGGKGMINILDSSVLINNTKLYSTFLLYLLSELFERLPEVGDLEKPKMIFFFDEAHLLFKDAPKALVEKIEQVVKLIRSKGVGVYFCTQNPKDIPDGVLAQLGNKIQHALHAYTPADQKGVKAAAQSFRENPGFDTYETIMALGTGEAVVSCLDENGMPMVAEKTFILPPASKFGALEDAKRNEVVKGSIYYGKYYEATDPESAYEILLRKGAEEEEAQRLLKEEEAALKQQEKDAKAKAKEEEKAKKKAEAEKNKVAKSVGNTVSGTVGREIGKNVGGSFGKFGKTLGGNVGASLGRGIFSTLFKK